MIAALGFPLYQKLVTGADRAIHPNKQFPGGTADYITVHMTGNSSFGAGAAAHANWMFLHAEYSWHTSVDDIEAWQSLPWHMQGWHAGDGYYGLGNQESIGVEICMNRGINQAKAYENAAAIVAMLRGMGHGHRGIKQHWDWTRKECPQLIRSNGLWTWFLGRVAYYEAKFTEGDDAMNDADKAYVEELKKRIVALEARDERYNDVFQDRFFLGTVENHSNATLVEVAARGAAKAIEEAGLTL